MKRLLTAFAFLALAVTAQAQTNFTILRLTVVTNGVTDQISLNLNARESEGFLLNYIKDVVTAGTNAPLTLQNSSKSTITNLLLAPLAEQARANDKRTNKVEQLLQNLSTPGYWDTLSNAQRQALKDLAAALIP